MEHGSLVVRVARVGWHRLATLVAHALQPVLAPGVERLEHGTEGIPLLRQRVITRDRRFELLAVLDEPLLLRLNGKRGMASPT